MRPGAGVSERLDPAKSSPGLGESSFRHMFMGIYVCCSWSSAGSAIFTQPSAVFTPAAAPSNIPPRTSPLPRLAAAHSRWQCGAKNAGQVARSRRRNRAGPARRIRRPSAAARGGGKGRRQSVKRGPQVEIGSCPRDDDGVYCNIVFAGDDQERIKRAAGDFSAWLRENQVGHSGGG